MTCKHLNFSSSANYGASNKQGDNMDTWDPMDDDFACPTFNSYKNFDVLNAEHPSDKYVLKQKVHTPFKYFLMSFQQSAVHPLREIVHTKMCCV